MDELMNTSLDIFPSQSSSDSSCNVYQRDVNRLFPKAVYRISSVDQSLWVLFSDDFEWKLLRTSRRMPQLNKEDFFQCCSLPLDAFMKEIEDYDSDPFSYDLSPPSLPPPVLHLVSSEAGHDIQISPALFRQLFGREAVLSAAATRPAYPCLLGLTDGRLLFWHPVGVKVPQLICHMYQPVIDILTDHKGSLLCVGQHGKVICIQPGKKSAEFSSVFLHGPVTSCCYSAKYLFHTTTSFQLWRSSIGQFDDLGNANVLQTRIPVLSAKKVLIDSLSHKVTYVSEDNVLSDVPPEFTFAGFASQQQKLHWLSDKISEQSKRAQELTQHTEQFSTLLHDLTCAAWLLTPDKCGLKCEYDVLPVPGQESTYNVRITFSELGKLCPSSLWSVCSSVSQKLGSTQTKLTQTVPVSNDIVIVDLTVPICLGSKVKSWGGHLRPPLDVECGVLFSGVSVSPLLASRPCPAMKFALQTFVLDEFSFFTEKSFSTSSQADSLDSMLSKIAKQKCRQELDNPLPLSLTGKFQCELKVLMPTDENTQDLETLVWQKILPRNLRSSHSKIFSLLEHEIKLWTTVSSGSIDDARHLRLCIETDCPSLLAGLRTSAIHRIKGICERTNAEVAVSKEAVNKAQALQSELQILRTSQSFDKVLQFYLKLRNEFSSNLLLV